MTLPTHNSERGAFGAHRHNIVKIKEVKGILLQIANWIEDVRCLITFLATARSVRTHVVLLRCKDYHIIFRSL